MVFTYYMHTKELHAVFYNHASYQASWVSTSTSCNSYPHIIHVNIFSIHIPTSFSKKKKLHVIQTKKSTCKLNFFFFPVFLAQKKKKKKKKQQQQQQHAYTNIIITKKKKLHVIQTKKLTCKLDFFFFFQFSSSEKQHAYTNILLTKKKNACYSNQEINMQTGFFFQFSSSEKTTCTKSSMTHNINILILFQNCSSGTRM